MENCAVVNDEKLIMLVEKNSCLYNKEAPEYKLPMYKQSAWTKIGKELGVTEMVASKRWKSLRERYSREKKKQQQPSGSGYVCHEAFPLFSAMSFLDKYVVPRPTRGTVAVVNEGSAYNNDINSSDIKGVTDNPVENCAHSSGSVSGPKAKRSKASAEMEEMQKSFAETSNMFQELIRKRLRREEGNEDVFAFADFVRETLITLTLPKRAEAISFLTDYLMEMKNQD